MLKKTIKYVDYEGNEREEDFFFNLTRAELINMFNSVSGGLEKQLTKIVATRDAPKIMSVLRDLVKASYGEKSPDGRRFMKSEEIFKNFEETEAYSIIFTELCTDDKAAAAFVTGILPKDMAEEASREMSKMLPSATA